MISKTRGIVFHRLKYSESSLIAKIYTEQFGLCSFMIQGARKKTSSSKANLLQPLSLIELVAYHKESSGLQKMKEMKNDYPLESMQNDIARTSIALFLSEMLGRSIREETPNKPLFNFLHESIRKLDSTGNPSCFHLVFLIKLSKFLGFFPQGFFSENTPFFDLAEGVFANHKPLHQQFLQPDLAVVFSRIISTGFEELPNLVMDAKTRKALLEKIIDYYRLHITGLQEIKSHIVLETVLRG